MAHPVDPLDIRTQTNGRVRDQLPCPPALEQLPYGGHWAALTGDRVPITRASDPPE